LLVPPTSDASATFEGKKSQHNGTFELRSAVSILGHIGSFRRGDSNEKKKKGGRIKAHLEGGEKRAGEGEVNEKKAY